MLRRILVVCIDLLVAFCYKWKSYIVQFFREFGWCQHIIWSLKGWTLFSGSGVQDCYFFWSISQWLHLFWIAMCTHPGEEVFRNRNSQSWSQTRSDWYLLVTKDLLNMSDVRGRLSWQHFFIFFFFYFDSWLSLNFRKWKGFFEKLYAIKKKFGAMCLYKVIENAQKHM